MKRFIASTLFGVLLAVFGAAAAFAQTIKIVAFGGSSTYGQGLERYDAYPANLEKALRAKGHNVVVTNAGVSGDRPPTACGVRPSAFSAATMRNTASPTTRSCGPRESPTTMRPATT